MILHPFEPVKNLQSRKLALKNFNDYTLLEKYKKYQILIELK